MTENEIRINETTMWREWITVRGLEPITLQDIDDRLAELKQQVKVEPEVKPEICVHISKIDSGGSFIDSERLSKRFAEYNLIPQLETKINLISEDGQYLEQFEVIQIYYEVDKKLKIDIYLDEY